MSISDLTHLPDAKRRELTRVLKVLFDEFDKATVQKVSTHKKSGRILKVILFGSYARGDWVEDRLSGYRSDYDLLVVVNDQTFTDLHEYWDRADERFILDLTVTRRLRTPVNFIVHSYDEVNDQLARGRPFFSDIARDGVMLYEAAGHPLAKPKALSPEEMRSEAKTHFDQWFSKLAGLQTVVQTARDVGDVKLAAFLLHQSVETLYHCVLLVLTLYSPKSHRINVLRSQAESLDPRLKRIWPRNTRFAKRAFARLQRAYVEARYSAEYSITNDEISWLIERVDLLQSAVATLCNEYFQPS